MENDASAELISIYLEKGNTALNTKLDEQGLLGKQRLKALDEVRIAVDKSGYENSSLDVMHDIYETCIKYALTIANGNADLVQYANVTSYNLSANLADCWFDDRRPRSTRHFKAGVAAAHRCLNLRRQLKKPPLAMAMAYFVLGVHEYSLGNFKIAETAWLKKLENEELSFDKAEQLPDDLNVTLSNGLIGLARIKLGSGDDQAFIASLERLEALRTVDNSAEVDLFKSELALLKEQQRHTS